MLLLIRRILLILGPQGIAAIAVQGGVATLSEGRDGTFPSAGFPLTEKKAPQEARYSRQERIEVRPFVPKGFSTSRQTESYKCAIALNLR